MIGTPMIGHTQTFISIGNFDNEFSANALLKYIKSKFARTMLGIKKLPKIMRQKKYGQKSPYKTLPPTAILIGQNLLPKSINSSTKNTV